MEINCYLPNMDKTRQVPIQLFLIYGAITVVIGVCNESIPVIEHAYPNETSTTPFADGSAVGYSCHTGFRQTGNNVYTCTNGSWVGDFQCLRTCDTIRELRNGKIVNQPTYVVGTRIAFECNKGYKMIGSKSLLCRISGEWRPLPPTCEIVSCGEFGYIKNAYIFQEDQNGQYNLYKSKVSVTCDEGYVIQGSPTVHCNADGTWDPKPVCKLSSCGTHPGYKSSCIADSSISSDGNLITFLCLDSSNEVSVTDIGSGTAFCYENKWDNLGTGCFCDCKVKHNLTVQTYNLVQNDFLKHNTILQWSCKKGFRKDTQEDINCFDGKINMMPSCVYLPTTTLPSTTSELLTQTESAVSVITKPDRPVHDVTPGFNSEIDLHNLPKSSASPSLVILIIPIVVLAVAVTVAVVLYRNRSTLKQKCCRKKEEIDAHKDNEKEHPKESVAMLPESSKSHLTPV